MTPIEPTVLEEASLLVDGDRRLQYGPAHVNFTRIAQMWGAYLGREVSMRDVCVMMTLLKLARQAEGNKRDNIVDSIGYLRLIEIIDEELMGHRLRDGE